LDLSAAFDTADYNIFIERLSRTYYFCSIALDWIDSYLELLI